MDQEGRSLGSPKRRELDEHRRFVVLAAIHSVLGGGGDGLRPCIRRHLGARRIKLASHFSR